MGTVPVNVLDNVTGTVPVNVLDSVPAAGRATDGVRVNADGQCQLMSARAACPAEVFQRSQVIRPRADKVCTMRWDGSRADWGAAPGRASARGNSGAG